jgi:hypothetical protein
LCKIEEDLMSGLALFKKSEDQQTATSVDRFLAAKGAGSGRLIFALDATASRAPTWEMARNLTSSMIREASTTDGGGKLSLQLVYFRGGMDSLPQCAVSPWTDDATWLTEVMGKVTCAAGVTQIARVLEHAQRETLEQKVNAMVFIGDACEPANDDLERLSAIATALGKLRTPVFAFQEGKDPNAEKAFRKLAEWSHGAYGRFDVGAACELGELLRAAAAFAIGGAQALEERKDAAARLLLGQLKGEA